MNLERKPILLFFKRRKKREEKLTTPTSLTLVTAKLTPNLQPQNSNPQTPCAKLKVLKKKRRHVVLV
jgi:hypothetical protein